MWVSVRCAGNDKYPQYIKFYILCFIVVILSVLNGPMSSNFPYPIGYLSQSGRTSYRKTTWRLKAARLDVIMIVSLWNLIGTSTGLPSRGLSNVRLIGKFTARISQRQVFMGSCGKTTIRLVNTQIANFMGTTWGPPGSCRPQMGPVLAPWILLSG